MAKTTKSKNIYASHRKNQREKILEVSSRLFIEKGIHDVTIADIAASSRLTRATIYKYFANREEIAFDIFKTIISGWHERLKFDSWARSGNGFQKIEMFLLSFRDYLLNNPEEIRYIAEFNYLYGREWSSSRVSEAIHTNLNSDRNLLIESVHEGIADGSLQPGLDPALTLAAIFNFCTSLLIRLGQMGIKIQEEYGISAEKIFCEIYRIFINGIKAETLVPAIRAASIDPAKALREE